MVLRSAYAPVLPEMDPFLFASVGQEIEGVPLSVLSALAQLGLDPRNEAARLSHLTSKVAANQLGRLFAQLPDRPWTSLEIRRTAKRLVELLPTAPNDGKINRVPSTTSGKRSSTASRHHLAYLALALSAALILGLIAHGSVAPGGQDTAPPVSQVDSVTPSAPMIR
jgi:hypothetical protein